MMNKHMKNNIGLLGILALIMAILIGCDGAGGDPDPDTTTPTNLYAWGSNNNGQLGIGIGGESASDKSALPVEVVGEKIWKQVSVGKGHTVAIDNDGALYAWGDNSTGKLGTGNTTGSNSPIKIGTETWTQVSVGAGHTVAIDNDGALYAWGDNSTGQLGIGTETIDGNEVLVDKDEPVKVGDKVWEQVSAGETHTVAIDSVGKLYAWGNNNNGQLGTGTEIVGENEELVDKSSPVPITISAEPTKTWNQVSAAGIQNPFGGVKEYTMAIDNDGNLYAWGSNGSGQLGTGNTTDSSSPIKIGTKTWKQVSAGGTHTVAIDSADKLYVWGLNYYGQLGTGTEIVGENEELVDKSSPVPIEPTKTWIQVDAGETHTVAIDSAGKLYAWGHNNYGQLGVGNEGLVNKSTPVPIEPTKTWNQVSAGANSNLGIIQ